MSKRRVIIIYIQVFFILAFFGVFFIPINGSDLEILMGNINASHIREVCLMLVILLEISKKRIND